MGFRDCEKYLGRISCDLHFAKSDDAISPRRSLNHLHYTQEDNSYSWSAQNDIYNRSPACGRSACYGYELLRYKFAANSIAPSFVIVDAHYVARFKYRPDIDDFVACNKIDITEFVWQSTLPREDVKFTIAGLCSRQHPFRYARPLPAQSWQSQRYQARQDELNKYHSCVTRPRP